MNLPGHILNDSMKKCLKFFGSPHQRSKGENFMECVIRSESKKNHGKQHTD